MTKFGWLALIGSIVAVMAVGLLVWGFTYQSASYPSTRDTIERTTELNPPELGLYSSGTYGFSFAYPAAAAIESDFIEPVPAWRTFTTSEAGTPIVFIRSGTTEARVGVSSEDATVSRCTEPAGPEVTQEPLEVNESRWSVFAADELGTDNERRITSYRLVHDGMCFAIETFEPLENTEPGARAPAADMRIIVQTFTFAR